MKSPTIGSRAEKVPRSNDQDEKPIIDWLKKNGATERLAFDEDTGAPVRVFSIKL